NGVRDCADYSDECPPEIFINNALTSRTEMIKNPFFKTMVWIMALLAILGNSRVFVILCKSLWSNRKKAKSAQASSVSTVNKLLILNLSIADFLMGISLLIIASKSAQYSGQYCLRDMNWRSSGTCNTVGVLSVISSEASVFTLVCITSYRLYSVYFPIQTRTLSRRVCGWWIVCIWTISFTIALIPLADSLSRTMVNAVCIPRYFKLNTDDTSLSPLSPVVVLFNFIALIYICAAYIAIYQRSSASSESTEQRQNEQRQIAAKKMQRKISILILTDLTCWLPVCLMTFISLGRFGLPDEVYAASAIIFLPINSSLNPLIYT
uniref:G-protein coupled receptors family 1 profile domain-containing protein n=1 Tax=Ciona savignyi TaxID=51511 RepID=H2ZF21_CIOSA